MPVFKRDSNTSRSSSVLWLSLPLHDLENPAHHEPRRLRANAHRLVLRLYPRVPFTRDVPQHMGVQVHGDRDRIDRPRLHHAQAYPLDGILVAARPLLTQRQIYRRGPVTEEDGRAAGRERSDGEGTATATPAVRVCPVGAGEAVLPIEAVKGRAGRRRGTGGDRTRAC